jgi:1-acyl-sn-glycerol-3-phosphate acyltransferase
MTFLERAAARAVAGVAQFISGAQARWFGDAPTTEQRVYFANHSSHLDFVVLWSSLPPEVRMTTRPVAAADYWSKGLRQWLACHVFRAVLVARATRAAAAEALRHPEQGRKKMIDPLLEVLDSGESLILFPEGTRGNGYEVAAFKSGLHTLCVARPGMKLVPVYLENLSRVLPKGEVLVIPIICKVSFGSAMEMRAGEGQEEFLTRARAALCGLRDA